MPAYLPSDPKCDRGKNCQDKWIIRKDDNVETISQRMIEYHNESAPLLE